MPADTGRRGDAEMGEYQSLAGRRTTCQDVSNKRVLVGRPGVYCLIEAWRSACYVHMGRSRGTRSDRSSIPAGAWWGTSSTADHMAGQQDGRYTEHFLHRALEDRATHRHAPSPRPAPAPSRAQSRSAEHLDTVNRTWQLDWLLFTLPPPELSSRAAEGNLISSRLEEQAE